MQILITFLAIFLLSRYSTGLVRRYALQKNLLDIPNDRSSHQVPIPRGGGISFVIIFTLIVAILVLQQQVTLPLFLALMGGVIVALIGWLDDIVSLHPFSRFIVHLLAALWAVYWLGSFVDFHFFGYTLSIIAIIWCINLYNFMDGIDGLAGLEGLFISITAAVTLALLGSTGISLLCFLLGASIAGFLTWNWPPAKIFMGDVGSSYLGYIFAILALATINFNLLPPTFWLVISGVFICDTTFTVLYRMLQGEPWYKAHRKHAYQRLVQMGLNHKTVTVSILFINLFLLFPIAIFLLYYPQFRFGALSLLLFSFFMLWTLIGKKVPKITSN